MPLPHGPMQVPDPGAARCCRPQPCLWPRCAARLPHVLRPDPVVSGEASWERKKEVDMFEKTAGKNLKLFHAKKVEVGGYNFLLQCISL